jgi:hypothetical protein
MLGGYSDPLQYLEQYIKLVDSKKQAQNLLCALDMALISIGLWKASRWLSLESLYLMKREQKHTLMEMLSITGVLTLCIHVYACTSCLSGVTYMLHVYTYVLLTFACGFSVVDAILGALTSPDIGQLFPGILPKL